ncbi:hydroxymethylbilane synthase [Ascidiimonas sp. W6]|uniref:hydroxymethylbilane synthase n=1 Tax=Ascidiimonas meishanensis TaxID=3128903 RepID=UPI0030ECCBE3
MNKTIRIGTRDSELALWQANTVKDKLEALGYNTQLTAVKSTGDLVLDKPLYELGITGIFTKTLDVAMIKGDIDIAVHSMKDVPTQLPKGIVQAAVLKRAATEDILVYNENLSFLESNGLIATGSLRRKAQWLHKYPNHQITDLRGNVNTRLKKLEDNNWNGAIFAKAGLERIHLTPKNHLVLDWMVPAPAQGAMLVVVKEQDSYCKEALAKLNHLPTEIAVRIERNFLRTLEGGCTAPIGALATIVKNDLHFKGAVFSLDGKEKIECNETIPLNEAKGHGEYWAKKILNQGGANIMEQIKQQLK